jgi:hypothetical protein
LNLLHRDCSRWRQFRYASTGIEAIRIAQTYNWNCFPGWWLMNYMMLLALPFSEKVACLPVPSGFSCPRCLRLSALCHWRSVGPGLLDATIPSSYVLRPLGTSSLLTNGAGALCTASEWLGDSRRLSSRRLLRSDFSWPKLRLLRDSELLLRVLCSQPLAARAASLSDSNSEPASAACVSRTLRLCRRRLPVPA